MPAGVDARPDQVVVLSSGMLKPAIFLDRDGTIIEERNYLADPDEVKLLEGAAQGLLALGSHDLPLVIVSNQSGIGRGYFSVAQAQAVQDRLEDLLAREGVTIAGWYRCPHDPSDQCDCRKPLPGMILAAASELSLDPSRSFMIGDKRCDIDLAATVGATGILVTTGYGVSEMDYAHSIAAPVCGNLIEASEVVARRLLAAV